MGNDQKIYKRLPTLNNLFADICIDETEYGEFAIVSVNLVEILIKILDLMKFKSLINLLLYYLLSFAEVLMVVSPHIT